MTWKEYFKELKNTYKQVFKYIFSKENMIFLVFALSIIGFAFALFSNCNSNNIVEKANAETTIIGYNTNYIVDIDKTWTNTTYPYCDSSSDTTINAQFIVEYGGTSYTGTQITIDRGISGTRKDFNLRFKNSNNYPFLNFNSSNASKKLAVSWWTSSSNYKQLTSANTVKIKFTSGINNFPSDLTNNLKYWLTNEITNYNITYAITNGSATTTNLPSTGGTIQITPNSGYTYPQTITVSGTANYTYDNTTGLISFTSVSSDLSIGAICPSNSFNLTLNTTACYITERGGYVNPTVIPSTGGTYYINPAIDYTYPQNITVTGTANYTYNNTTGVISITSVSSDLTIDIICELIQVNLNSGYYIFPTIKKLYDMGNLNIPVPNGLKLYQFTNESLTGINTPASGGTDYIGGYKYTTAEPAQEYTLTNSDYLTNNQTSTTFWKNNQGKLIRTIQSDNLTIEFTGFWVVYIPDNSTIEITAQSFYNELIEIPELRLIQEDLYYIIRQFQIDLATTATEKYNEGYAEGYDLGVNTNIISDSTTGVISSIFSGIFGTIFNIEIFPNFPLYILLLIPLVFSMLGVIFWLIRGR